MKYIMAYDPTREYFLPTVFPEEVTHAVVGLALNHKQKLKIRSAGFVHFYDKKWFVPDTPSLSLKIGPHPEDELILRLFLTQGLAGLDLKNMIAFLAIEAAKSQKSPLALGGRQPCSLPEAKPATPAAGTKRPRAGS